jgi:gas vesicle protein
MGKGTSELREEIEETRARVGEEVDALSYKTDVGARVGDYVDDKKEAVTSKVSGAKDAVVSVVPSRRSVNRIAHSNPLGLAIGAAAVGFVAGLLLPETRVEEEHLGDAATRVRQAATDAGQEALERGKDVAQSALQTVKEEGSQQSRELASDLKDRVQEETTPGERTPY